MDNKCNREIIAEAMILLAEAIEKQLNNRDQLKGIEGSVTGCLQEDMLKGLQHALKYMGENLRHG